MISGRGRGKIRPPRRVCTIHFPPTTELPLSISISVSTSTSTPTTSPFLHLRSTTSPYISCSELDTTHQSWTRSIICPHQIRKLRKMASEATASTALQRALDMSLRAAGLVPTSSTNCIEPYVANLLSIESSRRSW